MRLAVELIDRLGEIGVGVVDDVVGAQFAQPLHFGFAAGAGDHLRAGNLGQHHATHAHAAAGAQHQHLFAGLHLADGVHHPIGRAESHRQRGRLLVADAVRNADQLVLARLAQFGQAAVHGLAHQAALGPVDRVDQHAVAGLPALYARTDFDDFAGHVQPHDDRKVQLDAWHPPPGEYIVIVDRRCLDAQDHVAFARLRIGKCGVVLQDFRTAVTVNDNCLHGFSLLWLRWVGCLLIGAGRGRPASKGRRPRSVRPPAGPPCG
ncbi:Uncharacterised protein [Bordetella pertussis]|nr:Uncharacterised protein [Bordetella pertussis]